MTLPMLKQPLVIPPEARRSQGESRPTEPAQTQTVVTPADNTNAAATIRRFGDRSLMVRPAGAVFARHIRWGTQEDGQTRRRIPDGARPAGLYFSTLDWSGNGGGPTEHQKAQTVEQVFGSFNWT